MSKFKKGDTVRRINFSNKGLKVGSTYKVFHATPHGSLEIEGREGFFDGENFELVEDVSESKPHPHAELMAQYAEDAKETDRPWERWERRIYSNDAWSTLGNHPSWLHHVEYQRKPKTININGYEVPEPVRSMPDIGDELFAVNLTNPDALWCVSNFRWGSFDTRQDLPHLKRGLLHTTREAAELHAKALLSFTNGKG